MEVPGISRGGTGAALLLIDVQRNMLLAPDPVPGADAVRGAIDRLLATARAAGAVVVHIRNNGGPEDPDAPGTPGWELVNEVLPGEAVIDKHEPNAFAGTRLAEVLPSRAGLILAGMQSEWCVRETALAARELGYQVSLVRGAHATYDDEELSAAEASRAVELELEQAGVSVVDLASALR